MTIQIIILRKLLLMTTMLLGVDCDKFQSEKLMMLVVMVMMMMVVLIVASSKVESCGHSE